MNLATAPIDRFFRNFIPEPNSGCWLWLGHLNARTGYGLFRLTADTLDLAVGAHRAAYTLLKGDIGALHVCHRCDVRSCVNPDHLFLGTAQDNHDDASRKGRLKWKNPERPGLPRGERHPQARLTEDDVRAIRASSSTGVSMAAQYGVSPVAIGKIRRRHIWRHVQ